MKHKLLLGDKSSKKALGIMADVIYSTWLITPLFIQPTNYGLIKNHDMNYLYKIFLDFSKIIAHIMRGVPIYGPHMLTWMAIFSDFIESKMDSGLKFLNNVIDIKIPNISKSNICPEVV
jgi:hypothetical protein